LPSSSSYSSTYLALELMDGCVGRIKEGKGKGDGCYTITQSDLTSPSHRIVLVVMTPLLECVSKEGGGGNETVDGQGKSGGKDKKGGRKKKGWKKGGGMLGGVVKR
ncbi:hypothetical protein TrRE_jg8393, partial [Triparma retinervis]